MVVEMVKLLLSGLSTASNMVFAAIFKGTALLIVTILRLIQLPGWAVNCLLYLIRQSVETAIETVLDTTGKLVVSAVETGSELIANATTAAVSSFVEVTTVQIELLGNATAEVYEFALQTGAEITSSFCKNFWEAVDIFKNSTANASK